MKEECGNCKYFDRAGAGTAEMGWCCIRAPVVIVLPMVDGTFTAFPKVEADEWCGEWKGKVQIGPSDV